ncbi:MAG: hypothetical protein ACI9C1_002857 [Candidatus Aldehydirespiratoraceae bacterium]|jgi:hypothetical protein
MTGDEETASVSAEEIFTMAAEIERCLRPSESAVKMTPTHREVWDDLVDQRRGGRTNRPAPTAQRADPLKGRISRWAS